MAIFRKKKEVSDSDGRAKARHYEPDEFADIWQEAWNTHEPQQVLELCTEDVIWDDPLTPEPAVGHAEVRRYLEDSWRAFPDMTFSWPERAYSADNGNRLALHWHLEATMLGEMNPPGFAATGKRFITNGVDLLHLKEGRVAWYQGFFDRQSAAEQLGIMPSPGSRIEKLMVGVQRLASKRR